VLLRRCEAESGDRADRDDDLLRAARMRPERDEAEARLGENRLERDHRAIAKLDLHLHFAAGLLVAETLDLLQEALH
jgi:hypothetical protein